MIFVPAQKLSGRRCEPGGRGGGGGGLLLGILGGGMLPVLQNLTLFQTVKFNFPHPFSDLALRQKLCYHNLD